MDGFRFLTYLWFCHAAVAAPLVTPVAFLARRRVFWRYWELLVFIVPFLIWALLMSFGSSPKSLSNIGEVVNITTAIPIAAVLRVAIGAKLPQPLVAASLLSAVCLVAAGTYVLTPLLPE